MAAFRDEVRDFLKAHGEDYAGGAARDVKAWQALLIDSGYAARTIPREYGGFGAEPDILRAGSSPRSSSPPARRAASPTRASPCWSRRCWKWARRSRRPAGSARPCAARSSGARVTPSRARGSDLASLQTKAVEDGDDFVIGGSKIWTSTAQSAQMMFALIRTEPDAAKHEGISYVLIPMDTPGIEVRPLKTMTGQAEFNEVFFTDVRVPKDQVVGGRGRGWFVANTTLKHERGMLGDPNATEARLNALIELMRPRRSMASAWSTTPSSATG